MLSIQVEAAPARPAECPLLLQACSAPNTPASLAAWHHGPRGTPEGRRKGHTPPPRAGHERGSPRVHGAHAMGQSTLKPWSLVKPQMKEHGSPSLYVNLDDSELSQEQEVNFHRLKSMGLGGGSSGQPSLLKTFSSSTQWPAHVSNIQYRIPE